MYEYVVVEPRAQQSTAQPTALTPARSSKPSTCRSEYASKEVCTYMTRMLRPVYFPGAWSSWHLQVACLHLKCWTIHLLHLSVIPIHYSLSASAACGTARRPLREALCIYYRYFSCHLASTSTIIVVRI